MFCLEELIKKCTFVGTWDESRSTGSGLQFNFPALVAIECILLVF